MIGSLGPVVFEVSADLLRTLSEFTRNSAGRYARHEVLGKKPLTQFIGPGLDTVSFSVRFDARLGINPRKELDQLTELDRKGKAVPLMIGDKGVGVGLWVITGLEQTWDEIDAKGNVLAATVNITLEEYVK